MNEIAKLKQVAERIGGRFWDNYSGRGMSGAVCVGIVCDNAIECIEEAAAQGVRGGRVDTMGKRTIVYWEFLRA